MKGTEPGKQGTQSTFLDETHGKSDRAVVIEGAVLLDMHLIQLLTAFLIHNSDEVQALLKEARPLGTFAARIRAAFTLGLISQDERDDLRVVQYIREIFTRQLEDVGFSDGKVREWCSLLKLPESVMLTGENLNPRSRFVFGISLLVQRLALRIRHAEQNRRQVPEEYSLTPHTPKPED